MSEPGSNVPAPGLGIEPHNLSVMGQHSNQLNHIYKGCVNTFNGSFQLAPRLPGYALAHSEYLINAVSHDKWRWMEIITQLVDLVSGRKYSPSKSTAFRYCKISKDCFLDTLERLMKLLLHLKEIAQWA